MSQAAAQPYAPRVVPAGTDADAARGAPLLQGLRLTTAVGIAALVGLAMSTQYLFQPFVWTHWPWDDVLAGWLGVVRDRMLVAIAIACAIVAADRIPARAPLARSAWLALAIVAGALAGEALQRAIGSPGAPRSTATLLRHAAHWSAVAACVALAYGAWLRIVTAHAAREADELRVAEIERQLVTARLAMLRHQIEPHFLFNTLATVRRLRQAEAASGARLLASFLDFLRRSLAASDDARSTLAHEAALVRAYLEVVAVRLSGRLAWRIDVPADLADCEFPALALATLVENAVKHGIAPKGDGGSIAIVAQRRGDDVIVEVVDTGAGLSGTGGTGIGLANVRSRLRTLYGARGALALEGGRAGGVRAAIVLPYLPRSRQ